MRTNKTTKLLALTLSLLMLFTMIPLSVSAQGETGTILDTTIEGIETDGNGNYYLTSNVTVSKMITDEFTGTLNGNGYTVTTTVPLFKSVNNATVENFIVEGTVTGNMSAVVNYVLGDSTFRNITNNADVDGSGLTIKEDYSSGVTLDNAMSGGIAALIIGSDATGTTVKFENCINNGDITALDTTGDASVGGILGAAMFYSGLANADGEYQASIIFANCKR